jgi:hypothetical protein
MEFIFELKSRNELLFYFGTANLLIAIVLAVVSFVAPIELSGTNAWYKPIKFGLSIGIYALTMAWHMYYLPQIKAVNICSWLIVIMLGFEIIYITIQAARGELSHFNQSSSFYFGMYRLMGIAATVVAFITLYTAYLFFRTKFPNLPDYYICAIRLGMVLFFIFSLEGFVMGVASSHTIGGEDGGNGLPFLNWSTSFGDARVAHFIGMHALQVLPILAFYLLKNTKLTIIVSVVYLCLACYVLIQALQAKPLFKM